MARFVHSFSFLNGAFTFLIASFFYLSKLEDREFFGVNALTLGGYLYTYGSFWFVVGDAHEWWFIRIGCAFDDEEREALEAENAFKHGRNTWAGFWERGQLGANQSLSVLGSTLYLIGSVYFIPSMGCIEAGTWLFIVGSAVIVLSQSLKIAAGLVDTPHALVEWGAHLGALSFFIGSILFLPEFNTTEATENEAAWFYITGSLFFCQLAIAVTYREFFFEGNPIPYPPVEKGEEESLVAEQPGRGAGGE